MPSEGFTVQGGDNIPILVVDDDPAITFTVDTVLSRAGFSVLKASSGVEALERMREGFRGLVFMDIMMPNLDGWDTVQGMIDEGLLGCPMICMLTAVGAPGPRLDAIKEYVVDYIRKPFESDDLLKAIREFSDMINAP